MNDVPIILVVEDEEPLQEIVQDALHEGGFNSTTVAFARLVRQIDPAFPIVYMTGAAADDWGSEGVPNSILLKKPLAPAQLVTAVSQLLNAGSPS